METKRIKHSKAQKYFWKSTFRKISHVVMINLILVTTAFAQTIKYNISLSDTTVEAVINEVRSQSDVNLIYNNEEIRKSPNVSVNVTDASLEEVLSSCLRNTGLTYKKVNGTIVITPKKEETKKQIEGPDLTQTLRGTVSDRDSKITLPFATVHVLNTEPVIGTTSDVDGNFRIEKLPVGRYSIKISYVGYEDAILPEILVGSAKEVIINVGLAEEIHALGAVEVTVKKGEPLNEMASVSAISFSVEESKRYAASISDPARMAQSFAGVSTNDDASNEIVIRGNSPNWMLWRLEGVEIPSPNHFAEEGYSAGAVSILSTNMLGSSDFYTGAFPAEYGGALSGVFDINLRNGNNQEYEKTIQVGLLGVDLSAEGPFKKDYRGSFLFNYRYSTLSILNDMNIEVSENALPNYQDLSFKFNLPTKKAGTFSIWGIGGLSDVDEKFLPDTTINENIEDGYSDFTKTGMYATGLSHTIFTDDQSFFKTVISQSMSYSSENYKKMDVFGELYGELYDKLQNRAIRLTSYYNRKISSQLSIRSGLILNNLNYSYFSKIADDSTKIMNTYLDSDGSTNIYQAYIQSKYKFSDKVTMTAGAHYSHFALNSDHSLEPRLGLTYKLSEGQKFSLGYGMHSKAENLPVYFLETSNEMGETFMPNKSLKLTRSSHYVASYERMVAKNVNVKAELYYQAITNLPVPGNPDKYYSPIFGGLSSEDSLESIGKGRNYGAELTIQKYFTNNYYFLISSSLFDSKYKPADGKWRNTKYNINYINNIVGGKEFMWGDNRMIGFNGKLIWSGGKRLVPIDLQASKEDGEAVYDLERIYATKAKDYFRIDVGIKLHFFRKNTEQVLSLDIQNVMNRLNTWTEVYDAEAEKIIDYPMAGIIPVLNYRIEF